MYARKNAGRTSARRQSTMSCCGAGRTQPGLGNHLGGVADSRGDRAAARACPTRRGDAARRPAPRRRQGGRSRTRSCTKPGPLIEEEWEFIRRHTIIGERIISAAPALTRVAKLVRAQPRALGRRGLPGRARRRGDPARRADRRGRRRVRRDDEPRGRTRGGRSPEAALEELQRPAATQFDPDVVAAFAVAWRDHVLAAAA